MDTALPTKPGNPLEDFKQRVIDKLKNDIGTLMPDEVLHGLVLQAVKETFFLKRRVPKPGRSSYSDETVDATSWFQEEITRQVEPILKAEIAKHVASNDAIIRDAIKEALDINKMMLLTAAVIGDRVRDGMVDGAMKFVQELQQRNIIRY